MAELRWQADVHAGVLLRTCVHGRRRRRRRHYRSPTPFSFLHATMRRPCACRDAVWASAKKVPKALACSLHSAWLNPSKQCFDPPSFPIASCVWCRVWTRNQQQSMHGGQHICSRLLTRPPSLNARERDKQCNTGFGAFLIRPM